MSSLARNVTCVRAQARACASGRGRRHARQVTRQAVAQTYPRSEAPAPPEAMDDASNYNGADGTVVDRPESGGDAGGGERGKYYMHVFGCQMNSSDAERMAGSLESMGYSSTMEADDADVLVYNTCSIRDKSEQKVYSILGRQAKRKRENPHLRIVVAGCVAQQEGEQLLRRVPEVDLVMGPQHANRIDELLLQVEQHAHQVVATEPIKIMEDIAQPRRDSDLSAWVNIIYGCNEHCSYCVVPGTRGKEQSRLPKDIKREMYALGEAGYKEVTLLGQNIDAYGRDLPGIAADGSGRRANTLTDLLYEVHDAPGIDRIRFATSHPRYFSKRLIKALAELPKMCEYVHLPFQSGDNEVLRGMKRGYSREKYLDIINNIKTAMTDDVALTTDIIVGFPGETEEQFQNTLKLYEEVQFDNAFTAAYSPRPNTPAAEWDNQVADLIKADRLNRLNEMVRYYAGERSKRFLGRELEVLVDGPNPEDPENECVGKTRHNKLIFFPGRYEDLKRKTVMVKCYETRAFTLFADFMHVVA